MLHTKIGELSWARFLRHVGLLVGGITLGACSSDEPGQNNVGGAGAQGNSGGQMGTGSNGAGAGTGSGGGLTGAGGGVNGSGAGGGSLGGGGATQGTGGVMSGAGGSMMGSDEEYPVPDHLPDEDGGDLWLRFPQVPIPMRLAEYQATFTHVVDGGDSATMNIAESELATGLSGLTGATVMPADAPTGAGAVVIGTPSSSTAIADLALSELAGLGDEGYLIKSVESGGATMTVVAANTDIGVLYGSYTLLRHLQSHNSATGLNLASAPKVQHRLLNHWDNLDRSVERGYAGQSLWNWNALPGTLSPRYEEYARANASLGINGTALTNVNADAEVLTAGYLNKVKALADVFRPYGIRVYLTARFSAPIEIGGLNTADPQNAQVANWWKTKTDEIYDLIPDFGGYLVKANSEGQPGPQDYNRDHADGANMLAAAVGDRGIVMWRAFVYGENLASDRIKQAYEEFKPLDGSFSANVLVQSKNGPLDFMPREPVSSVFGAMPSTPLALELQITKEYLGQDTHLAYLGTYYEEVLKTDTLAQGQGSTIARIVDGTTHNYSVTAIAGVSNVGSDANWTGSQFNQANWYVYGRMAWDPDISAGLVAEEWVRQTFSNDPTVVEPVVSMMMDSREHLVNYMTPLGLAHIMAEGHHYGPGPWVDRLSRAEWNSVYYHDADGQGIGFDRTASGSNAVAQYASEVAQIYGDRNAVPENLLLFFHHVGWDEALSSGRSVWEELVHLYSAGVDGVADMKSKWQAVAGRVDQQRFDEVMGMLNVQHHEARWWRDACLSYFSDVSGKAIPSGYAQPKLSLAEYENLETSGNVCPANRDKPRCPEIEMGEASPAILP